MNNGLLAGLLGFVLVACSGPIEPSTVRPPTAPEQPEPISIGTAKPNVMLLVDKSGSMDLPLAAHESCENCRGDDCPQATCPTRWAQMRSAMDAFLSDPEGATVARYGLAMFPEYSSDASSPAENSCNGTGWPRLPIPDVADEPHELSAAASNALTVIKMLKSPGGTEALRDGTGGGTPTSKSLRTLGNLASLNDPVRTNVILLLTDGKPNCNEENPVSFSSDPVACECSVFSGGTPACGFSEYDRRGCRDATASIEVVRELRAEKGIRTVVIGFGDEMIGGEGAAVMNAMAAVGGLARRCDAAVEGSCGDADSCTANEKVCGGSDLNQSGFPCSTSADCLTGEECLEAPVCARKYFAARDRDELLSALRSIAAVVDEICIFRLSQPLEDASSLFVKLNDQELDEGPDAWTFDPSKNAVVFEGTACTTIKAGTEDSPVRVLIVLRP